MFFFQPRRPLESAGSAEMRSAAAASAVAEEVRRPGRVERSVAAPEDEVRFESQGALGGFLGVFADFSRVFSFFWGDFGWFFLGF